jgi:hypothetical protein
MYLPSGHLIKNNAPIEFPDVLDLNELVLGKPVLPVLKPTTMKSDPEVGFMMEDEMSNYMGPLKPVEKERIMESLPEALELVENVFTKRPFRYRLASMILHYGHHDSGHFVALRRVKYKTPNGIREAWFRISDATVERIVDVENDVFYHGSRFCYMLFYQRE